MNLKDLEWHANHLADNNLLSHELVEAAKHMRDIMAALRTSLELSAKTEAKDLPTIIGAAIEPTIVAHVSGGVLTNVTADRPVRVLTVDYDTDGNAEAIKDPDGDDCIIGGEPADVDAAYVAKIEDLAKQ